jgi:DNA-binding response OmpR family regulator
LSAVSLDDRRVLLLEDNVDTARAVQLHLEREAFVVDRVGSLADARVLVQDRHYACLIIDRRLPDGDGLALLAALGEVGTRPPALVLTARGRLQDRVEGLRAGADDYLLKPFAMAEMVERIHSLLRRPPYVPNYMMHIGDLSFDPGPRQLRVRGTPVPVPRRELAILALLMRRPGAVFLHEDIVGNIYGIDTQIESNAIEAHVSRLRARLRRHGSDVTIMRIRGVGYLLQVPMPSRGQTA